MRRTRAACVLVAVLTLTLNGCGSDDDGGSDAAAETTSPTVGTARASDGLDVTMDDNYFDPKVISGESSVRYRIDLVNEGTAAHNFSVAPSIDIDVEPGAKKTVEVVFPERSDLEFFCKFHKVEAGMVGTLRATA